MDRIREARRGSMAAVNGSLSRRRQRNNSLRDSPEEDGAIEMQETSRLRDRGGKKDRDRDRSGRNKRRRGDRMLHGSHREEGEDSSEESVDEDDEDEEEDSSVAVRLQPPTAQNPAPASSGMQSHNIRKGYPVKPVRPPGTCPWKVAEEMIGAPIPRKARSSSVKRSQECWISGGGGGCGGGEQVPCQASMSPARRSPSSTAPVSPSSSNVSSRKRMRPITVPKPRPPKTSKSSSIQEIEIEVAEVLFGMTRQVPSKQEDHRHDPKESNGSGNEVKSRVSSPNPISPPATSQPSTLRPSNPGINSFPLTATAPKRKRPRMRIEDESPTSPPSSTALPATSCSSVAKMDTEVVLPLVGTKSDPASPRSEKNASPAVENGGFSSDQAVSNVSSAIVFASMAQQDSVKAESIPDLKDTDSRSEKKAKEEAFSPPKESPAANLDVNIEEAPASKASMISDTQREEKFSIDLMAPPGKSSPEVESNSDYVAECKPVVIENAPKPEVISKAEGEKIEKKSKSEAEEIVQDDKNGGKPSTDDSDSRKPAGKERNLYLQLDVEKLEKDVTGAIKHQVQKQQSKAPRTEPKTEKAGPSASLPLPMQITGWPGGFPPFGFMGQVPPLPPVVPVDGTSSSSKLSFLPSQLRPKRCAAHCYIAQNIHYHQQITRLNPFWPSAAGAAPLYASKQYNLNTAPPSDSAILGSPLQGGLPGKSLGSVQEKGLSASAAHSVPSSKDKSIVGNQFMDVSQRKPPSLPQSSQPGSAGNMLAPAFIFPLNQQQAAAAGAAAAAANRSGVAKLTPGSGNTAQSSSSAGYAAVGASGANGSGTSMSFNYPGLPPNEAQYLAFLQNNAYSFPIPAHVGGAQPYRGASPAQAMPFFNLSFYPSQMIHPSQLRLQQQPPSSQQPPYSQQGHQNPSTSSGSSSSQKNTQQSQRVPAAAAASAITAGNSHVFPSSKQQHLSHSHQVRQLEPEPGGEDAPSTADSRVSQAQKNMYAQKFSMPTHSQNFALIAPAAAALSSGVGNHNEKQQQQQSQNQVMKVDLTPSQAFAMSFASFGGAAASAAAGGAAPHGLDFSSMAQNHAIFQSLPETVRHGYQVSAAAAAAHSTHQQHQQQQQQQHNKKPEDGKSPTDLGNTSTVGEEGKISSANKTPPGVAPRVSSRPASAAPASNSVTSSSNSQHLLSQQHQQQVLQLPKQVQQLQLQQQQQQRAKSVSSHSNASLYTDRMPGNSTAAKFPQGLGGFSPALIQSSASSQPTQWKASTRAANPSSTAALTAATPSPSTSVKNQIPLQQQVRSQQPPVAHQTHQISFGVSPAKVAGQSSQHLSAAGNNAAASLPSAATIAVGSPQNSVSKSSSGSPHSSAMAKSVPPPSPVLPVMPFQKQQSGKNSSSSSTISPLPATNRNLPSILGNPQNLGSKPQPSSQHLQQPQMSKQHSPQAQTAQLFFSYPYMQQPQTSQSDTAGYFQQHRRQSDQHRQNSTPASTGMLSLGPSSLSLSAVPDPSKGAGAAATSNSKNLMPTNLLQHQAQFATISQSGSGANAAAAHPLMYIHAMQSVPLKPDVSSSAEQKPAAGR